MADQQDKVELRIVGGLNASECRIETMDGRLLDNVLDVKIIMQPGELNVAYIKVFPREIDIKAEGVVEECPGEQSQKSPRQ